MTTNATATDTAWRWDLLTAGCLAALLAFWLLALALNQTDLFFDEAQYWSWSREPAFGYFSKPPMIAWLITATTAVCGNSEFCVRLASPLLYTVTSWLIFVTARTLFHARIGFWAALTFATLPAVSLSTQLISTDVPLLFFWTAALAAWVRLLATRDWQWSLVLGLAIGLGLLSKYAMFYFYLCAGIYLVREPSARWLLRNPRSLLIVVIPALMLVPNFLWNLENGFITFSHTVDNAKWGGDLFHPIKALEFFGAQFGVFGPILFATLIIVVYMSLRSRLPAAERMLAFFSVPVILLITCQALLSRAHANWAAVAYPAAAILVTAWLARYQRLLVLRASLVLHLVILLSIAGGNMSAHDLKLPGRLDPYKHILGWKEMAEATRKTLSEGNYSAILTEDRWITAELLYYLRDTGVPILAWRPGSHPRDHYQLTRAYTGEPTGRLLLVTRRRSSVYVTKHFETARPIGTTHTPAGAKSGRDIHFFSLENFRRPAN